MTPSKSSIRRAVVAAAVLTLSAPLGHAAEVMLRLKEGGFEVGGTLKGFDGTHYLVDAGAYGMLRLEAARFTCTGEACEQRGDSASGAIRAAAATAVSAAATAAAKGPERLAIHGSTAIGAGLMPGLIRAWAGKIGAEVTQISGTSPDAVGYKLRDRAGVEIVDIELQRRGSAAAFTALAAAGTAATIGMSARRVTDEEAALLARVAPQIRSPQLEHVLGRDGIAVVVSPENRIRQIGLDALARIFSGQITDWAQLGQRPGRIAVHALASGSGTFGAFNSLVLQPRKLALSSVATRVASNDELADAVARDPNAIGFTALAFVRNAKPLDIEGTCGLISSPTSFTLKNEEYPLARRLYLYTAAPLQQPLAKDFLQYALSPEAQETIRDSQFVDQAIEAIPVQLQAARLAGAARQPATKANASLQRLLTEETKAARRLSVTFRFAPGSSLLDVKSRQDVLTLSRQLAQPAFKGRTILLMGFSDPVGTSTKNVALSLGRAGQVRAALLAASGGVLDPRLLGFRGYGALAPVACSDTDDGLTLNRRVEVWVRD